MVSLAGILKINNKKLLLVFFCLWFYFETYGQESADWIKLDNEEFGFIIEFPGQPTSNPQVVNTVLGKIKMNVFQLDLSTDSINDNLIYMVNYSEYPDSIINESIDTDDFFKSSINGMVTNIHGRLLEETVIDIDGYAARAVRININEGAAVVTSRLVLVRNKYFILMTITETRKDLNKSMDRFFESFQLKQ